MKRRKTRKIRVGKVEVGGDAPISVQSMTSTDTSDVKATAEQIRLMQAHGADIARVSCPDTDSTAALREIIRQVDIPVIADIHFHYRRGLEAADAGAAALRINPGNIGSKEGVREVVRAAKANGCSMRIGVNGGSLAKSLLEKYGEPCADAMVESALDQAKMLEDEDFREFKISVKSSDTRMTIEAYRKLAARCDYPLHLGVTEAGGLIAGTVKNAMALGMLLSEGIGDTLRVSLSCGVAEEVKAGFEILKALDLRHRGLRIVSCPTCARKGVDVVGTVSRLEEELAHITKPLTVAVMGCIVNGHIEAAHADVAVVGLLGSGQAEFWTGGKRQSLIRADESYEQLKKHIEKL